MSKIVESGKYLFTMKTQQANLDLLSPQLTLDGDTFRNKSISELRTAIRDVHTKCSVTILRHLRNRFDVGSLAKRLPSYFLGLGSMWIEELVKRYESGDRMNLCTEQDLIELYDDSINNDWLKNDTFRNDFRLQPSPFNYGEGEPPQLELNVDWDSTLCLAFPQKILEPYRKLFRLSFLLRRARYLLTRKRFAKCEQSESTGRIEQVTIFEMIRFVSAYHSFVFLSVANEALQVMLGRLKKVESLEDVVEIQHEFLRTLFDRARLDMEKQAFAEAINGIIEVFASYASDDITLNEANTLSQPLIGRVKKILLKSADFLNIRNLLFGSNFMVIGEGETDEPIWMSLRRTVQHSATQ